MFNNELTKHLAELSKLGFSDSELEKVTKQMSDIIDLMDKVKEIDKNLETFSLPSTDFENLRPDTARESVDTNLIVKNAKSVRDNAFVVPKVV